MPRYHFGPSATTQAFDPRYHIGPLATTQAFDGPSAKTQADAFDVGIFGHQYQLSGQNHIHTRSYH